VVDEFGLDQQLAADRKAYGATRAAAVISLPRSQVEMTDWDTAWQEKISKVVRRVSKDLIVNDEAEIGDVIRRRLFDDTGKEAAGKAAAKIYADWCFERRAQLPPEWTAVDTSATETKARDFLKSRFEGSFPFHPATLSVFQRKWQSLSSFSRLEALWPCWPNGSPGPTATATSALVVNR
jgi:predicted AAA+ superfamily ATPase